MKTTGRPPRDPHAGRPHLARVHRLCRPAGHDHRL